MTWRLFEQLQIAAEEPQRIKRFYSVTGDILAYEICPRQYGLYNHRRYRTAHSIQLWFGLVVHQVLNNLHATYQEERERSGVKRIPTDDDVSLAFEQVCDSLNKRGIRWMDKDERDRAQDVLKAFNRIEGPTLFRNIVDTEYPLKSDRGDFYLEGIVDILVDGSGTSTPPFCENVEIWDYKASRKPDTSKPGKAGLKEAKKIEKYEFQMLVYASLYRMKTGKFPKRGVLYFMNELADLRDPTTPLEAIRERATITFDFTDPNLQGKIDRALEDFSQTVGLIEEHKALDSWPAPDAITDPDTCSACDLRWDCQSDEVKRFVKMRYP
ncbi:MAG TPA: PD-(D/E)XK nuclease family protein [Methanoregulaceae archaeon]|nr:PD-(D/E)XK nuclease family protein [Methanoregulaceae archaeon]